MTILTENVHVLNSAVPADVPEGGGPMTGVEVVDGSTHNLFPAISTGDRAGGRVNFRKVFGVVWTDNTDIALGASFAVMRPPADPLVHVTMFQTDEWADTLSSAKQLVERYLVKGSKLLCRVQDVHYEGALMLQLYQIAPGKGFPAPGDSVVLRNPDGTEQFVRVLKTNETTQTVIVEGSARSVNLSSNELLTENGDGLEFDLQGKSIQLSEPSASNTAVVYSTTPAAGAKFYGVKKLAVAAAVDDLFVTVSGGIYTPLVPAATLETPVVDQYPLIKRTSLSRTASSAVALPATVLTLSPGAVLKLPTAVEPASLTMSHGATQFTSNASGEVLQGATVVGDLDARGKTLTMRPTAPNYGSASNIVTYKPATAVGATAHSGVQEVTTANRGLGWVFAFEPPPAPGTLVVSYMAQGRWYDLYEDGTGKLSGDDTSYGSGTLSFQTGSLALSLGALPDAGSMILFLWGDEATAKTAIGTLPTRAHMVFDLLDAPRPGTLAFSWSRGATPYTATVSAAGVVTGPADVGAVMRREDGTWYVTFAPHTLPDGVVSLTYQRAVESTAFTPGGSGSFTLTDAPIRAGSLRFRAVAEAPGQAARVVDLVAGADGVVRCNGQVVGTVNAASGVVAITSPTFTTTTWTKVKKKVVA